MKAVMNNPGCKPMVECEVSDPYSNPSVLAQSRCFKVSDKHILDLQYQIYIYIEFHLYIDCWRHCRYLLVIFDGTCDC